MKRRSDLELAMEYHLRVIHAPKWQEEYRFDPQRRWAFDFAWPERMLALEVEGGTWQGGRHTSGAGFERDCEKYNHATLAGWRVLRFTSGMIADGSAIAVVEKALEV